MANSKPTCIHHFSVDVMWFGSIDELIDEIQKDKQVLFFQKWNRPDWDGEIV